MNRKTVLWIIAAALVVAVSALMPELALRIQDSRLENAVQSQPADTVDLSILSELSIPDTLYLVQNTRSRVVLEQGRQMTEAEAEGAAIKCVSEVLGPIVLSLPLESSTAVPWLYVGAADETVVLWQVELTGQMVDPFLAIFLGEDDAVRAALDAGNARAVLLVDEHSGQVVSFDIRWEESVLPTPETVPTAEPWDGTGEPWDEAGDHWYSAQFGNAQYITTESLSESLMMWMRDRLTNGGGSYQLDPEVEEMPDGGGAVWRATAGDGTVFPVRALFALGRVCFNPLEP